MFQFFESLLNFISSVVDFIISGFQSVAALIVNCTMGVTYLLTAVGFMPVFLVPFITALIGLAVVKFVLSFGGR